MHAKLLLTAAAAGLMALPCPAAEPAGKPPGKPVTVPVTVLPSRHLMVSATVNGKGPYNLIFDTGAPLNIVTSRLAKDAGLVKKGRGAGGFGLFGGVNQIDVDKFQVGDLATEKLPAVVMDHPTVKAISDAFDKEVGRIDGIVGFPFFGRYATSVDYQKKQLTLTPSGYSPGDYMADLTKNLMNAADRKAEPRVVGAAGLWGFAVEKGSDDDDPGVGVKEVFASGPAAAAGLKVGDRVLTIDGRWADTVADAYLAASLVKPGRAVDVVVNRGGKEVTVSVTPVKGY